MREFKKGSLTLMVLHLLYEQPSYGWEICENLRTRSDGTLNFEDGAIYPLLHSLEHDDLAEGFWETNEDPIRKGARRRYYRLTPKGVEALRSLLQEWNTFSEAVGQILHNPSLSGEGTN